jgi:hypothetical protein
VELSGNQTWTRWSAYKSNTEQKLKASRLKA